MNFRLELNIPSFSQQIRHADKVMLMGSCFTEHITAFMEKHKFRVLQNPHGILFNPHSIANATADYASGKVYDHNDLFESNGIWYSWHHHGRFSTINAAETLENINRSIEDAAGFLKECQWTIVTLGSAWVYALQAGAPAYHPGLIAANCHKVPASFFDHRMLELDEVLDSLNAITNNLRRLNPAMRIIFTISPVRHAREGLIENNRSKGLLHYALQRFWDAQHDCFYFPAYELVMDDLRDYRFYAEDMVHPNYQATRYVWDKFRSACISDQDEETLDEAYKIVSATQHRALYPESHAHQQFLKQTIDHAKKMEAKLPWIDFTSEIEILRKGLLP